MQIAVQTDSARLLSEALRSQCSSVRFGSEFCESLLPNLSTLERACDLARERGKEFTYVTPRLSNAGVRKLKEQLPLLSEKGEVTVVANDFGTLNMLQRYPNLRPHLGRNLFLVPARSAWAEGHIQCEERDSDGETWIRELYSTTSLSYQATAELYRSQGCQRVDVDYTPRIFPGLSDLLASGFRISVLLHLVPLTFTRKCHMARFLGERSPETCSRPCQRRAFVLKNEALDEYAEEFGLKLFLNGNTVFRVVQPTPQEIVNLERAGVAELVLLMNPITRLDSSERIDDLIQTQCAMAPA